MGVKVINNQAKVHSLALSGPRDFLTLKPGDNYVPEKLWERASKVAADLVRSGVLKVETGVTPPPPTPKPAPPTQTAEEKEEAADEAASDETGEGTRSRRRYR